METVEPSTFFIEASAQTRGWAWDWGTLLWGTFTLPPAWPCTVGQVWVSEGCNATRGTKACTVLCQELPEHQVSNGELCGRAGQARAVAMAKSLRRQAAQDQVLGSMASASCDQLLSQVAHRQGSEVG